MLGIDATSTVIILYGMMILGAIYCSHELYLENGGWLNVWWGKNRIKVRSYGTFNGVRMMDKNI